jgi:hypothetical protein
VPWASIVEPARHAARSSASEPARVARTVALMPPPSAAIVAQPRRPGAADLGAAVAQPDGMRVRVHEARDDGAAGGVDRRVGGAPRVLPRVFALQADDHEPAVLGAHRGVRDAADFALGLAAACGGTERRREAGDVADFEAGGQPALSSFGVRAR